MKTQHPHSQSYFPILISSFFLHNILFSQSRSWTKKHLRPLR